jgi:hypothetical protein
MSSLSLYSLRGQYDCWVGMNAAMESRSREAVWLLEYINGLCLCGRRLLMAIVVMRFDSIKEEDFSDAEIGSWRE